MFEHPDLPNPNKPLSQYSDEFTISAQIDTVCKFGYRPNELFYFVNTSTRKRTNWPDTAFERDKWHQVAVTRDKTNPRLFINNREVFADEKIVRVKLSGLPHSEDRYDFQSLISS